MHGTTLPDRGCATDPAGQRCLAGAADAGVICGCTQNSDCNTGFVCDTAASRCTADVTDSGTDAGTDASSDVATDSPVDATADGTSSDASSNEPRRLTGTGACACRTAGGAGSKHGERGLLLFGALALASVFRRRRRAAA
jgi:MYXO-CTERM domain-containing protein